MEQELNIAYDQKLTREVWQRVAQSLPPLEAPAADTGSCGSCTVRRPAAAGPTLRLRKTRRTCVCGTFSTASVRRSTATPPPCCTCWKTA